MFLPLSKTDISSFAKKLKSDLDERVDQGLTPPSHLELLNMLAQAAGMRNIQTFRALVEANTTAAPPLVARPRCSANWST